MATRASFFNPANVQSMDDITLSDHHPPPLPPDYQDRLHPHFPGSLEAQGHTRKTTKWTRKNILLLATGAAIFIAVLIASLFSGIKIAQSKHTPVPENTTHWETVTETVTHLYGVQLTVSSVPPPTTQTVWISYTPSSSLVSVSVPLRPISTPESSATPLPSLAVIDNGGKQGCMITGSFTTGAACGLQCSGEVEEGKIKTCEEMDVWRCVVCDVPGK